ncbi:MAG TPA: L-aspartate oxidase [Vicinamibacterales bacterium]|nr:L-aspartate oxidase [Vicinamibacterales bacterium]
MQLDADFIIVGRGIAGLRALADLADAGRVVLLTKAGPAESNTAYAQGGIAAPIGPGDSPELHAADTIAAGAGLCDPAAVDVLVGEGPRCVHELISWGCRFDCDADGRPALAREGAHSVPRVLHARDATGREIARTLWEHCRDRSTITVLHGALAVALVMEDGVCRGVRFLDADGRPGIVRGRACLLATGGAGRVFRETTNPPIATGDGIAMAYRAGARVSDLEFIQFHPTVLAVPGAPRFLLSEALRGEGARLVNAAGEPFMDRYDPRGDLAARDVVAAAIVREQRRTNGGTFLSLAHLDPDRVRRRFPMIAEICARVGLDLARDPLPVSPAAHYVCGGVDTDLDGRTSVAGLFAAGEVACTRVHGANRLASNSLLEGLVFGARAARAMRGPLEAARLPEARLAPPPEPVKPGDAGIDADDVPDVLWTHAGLERERSGLMKGLAAVEAVSAALEGAGSPGDAETARNASIALVGTLILRAALRREESRGGHRRSDFPERDDLHWQFHIAEARGAS